jgi:signal transduction histidine kinase
MAAGLAHEIRNPLAGVKGAAQYLESEELEAEAKEMLQVIVDEVDRLDIVVSQFLDYARPFELTLRPDHVNAIVAHAVALVRAQGLPAGVEVDEDLAGDLPRVPIDAARLSQVVLNLVRNALQAMPNGGRLSVRTRLKPGRGTLPAIEIAVQDSGEGIAPDDLDNVFIPFFTTKYEGTGLGLPLCQRIVEAHGGELEVSSKTGVGSTFFVRLHVPPTAVVEASATV